MGNLRHFYRCMIDRRPSSFFSWMVFLLLWPFARLYRLVVDFRAGLYHRGVLPSYRAPVPVISVGNLTVGGTGKTPVCDAVVKHLLARGLRVTLVSRGYGGSFAGEVGVVAMGDGQLLMKAAEAGDEPCLLAQRNPALQVVVARKRAHAVRAAVAKGADVVVLDDGFQHLAVQRDLDIVLLDSRAPFGNGQLLPAGPLREPTAALRRADLLVMTHAACPVDQHPPFHGPVLRCHHRLAERLQTLAGEDRPWLVLAGRQVVAFAGIARPEDFFSALRARGVVLSATLAFNDHQDYAEEQLKRLIQTCDNNKLLITTEKDAVKLRSAAFTVICLVAPLELTFDEPGKLERILDQVVERSVCEM
jgi:tetraacyldisaccharide 4'-kinase